MTWEQILYAPNIHQGGGRVLLLPLLEELRRDPSTLFVLDSRLDLRDNLTFAGKVIWVKPTIVARIMCERWLTKLVRHDTRLLCMGNLPPLLASSQFTTLFLQNRYLLENIDLFGFSPSVRVRIGVERAWLHLRFSTVRRFVVQTPIMRSLVRKVLARDAEIWPFFPRVERRRTPIVSRFDFLYVASGEPHKNHRRLINAWILLARQGLRPSLALTLDNQRDAVLHDWVARQVRQYDLNITMVGRCSTDEVADLYSTSRALIYPSLFESLGLPLIEAVSLGLPVLAAKRDYVFDVLDVQDVFDPLNPEDIAEAVACFDFRPARMKLQCMDPTDFLKRALQCV